MNVSQLDADVGNFSKPIDIGVTLVAHGDLLKSSFITQECLGF